MARTEDTALSALLSALGKGVMQLPVEMEKQKEVQRQNALTSYQMMQQQEQQRQQQERSMLQNQLTKLQMQELNEKIRRAAMEPYMTEEQRMAIKQKNELEQIRERAKYDIQQAESVANINNRGRVDAVTARTNGGMANVQKFAPTITNLLGQNRQIAQTNARIRQGNEEARSNYIPFEGSTPPVPSDTLPHLQIRETVLPMMLGAGIDSTTAEQFLNGFTQPTAAPLNNAFMMPRASNVGGVSWESLTPEDIAGMSDEQLKAILGQ